MLLVDRFEVSRKCSVISSAVAALSIGAVTLSRGLVEDAISSSTMSLTGFRSEFDAGICSVFAGGVCTEFSLRFALLLLFCLSFDF